MKQAVASWEALAAAYSAYGLAFKNVSAALSDYSEGIVENIHLSSENSSSVRFGVKTPTNDAPATDIPTSPHFMCSPILEVEEKSETNEATDSTSLIECDQKPHLQTYPGIASTSGGDLDSAIAEIMKDLDHHSLEASERIHEVLEILEAPHIGYGRTTTYAAGIMKAITWNNSSTIENATVDEGEVHGAILEWEARLYKELKALGPTKIQYERKSISLKNKQKGASERAKANAQAAVSHFRTSYVVGQEVLDMVISEIERLRDEVLYQRLVKLVDVMTGMWASIQEKYDIQVNIVAGRLRGALDVLLPPMSTSRRHRERTALLWKFLKDWHSQFEKLVIHQKKYIEALDKWTDVAQQQIANSMEKKVPSPPIKNLLDTWKEELEMLPYVQGVRAIDNFSEVIREIMVEQEYELNLRKKNEEIYADSLEKEPMKENLMTDVEKHIESCKNASKAMRVNSVRSLTVHFEHLLQTMSEFALASSEMYKKVKSSQV